MTCPTPGNSLQLTLPPDFHSNQFLFVFVPVACPHSLVQLLREYFTTTLLVFSKAEGIGALLKIYHCSCRLGHVISRQVGTVRPVATIIHPPAIRNIPQSRQPLRCSTANNHSHRPLIRQESPETQKHCTGALSRAKAPGSRCYRQRSHTPTHCRANLGP